MRKIAEKAYQIKSVSFFTRAFLAASIVFVFALSARAQTDFFTYQGRLTDGSMPAAGTYNMQFSLYEGETGGAQIGQTETMLVTVTNGIFTVRLNFGAEAFNTASRRFLEIAVKKTSDADYTVLAPRQEITSAPFARRANTAAAADALSSSCVGCVTNAQIASIAGSKITGSVPNATNATSAVNATNATTASNALSLGGQAAGQYVLTSDARLSNARTPTGTAGGDLTGSYPNPTVAANALGGTNIANGTLGMADLFVFTGVGQAVGSNLSIAAHTCVGMSLNVTSIFDVREGDVMLVSTRDLPNGIITTHRMLNASDVSNDILAFGFCNVTNNSHIISTAALNRYMIFRPDGSAAREGSSRPVNLRLPPATVVPSNPNDNSDSADVKSGQQ